MISFGNASGPLDPLNVSKDIQSKSLFFTRPTMKDYYTNRNEVVECSIQKNLKIIDLTGAGDLFAAGFLHGHINNLSLKENLEKGTKMSSKVIQQIGARL